MFFLTEFLIVFGFAWTLAKKKSNFSSEYILFIGLNIAIIGANLLLPRLADTFLMSRFYQTTLIMLAPLGVIGGIRILARVPKLKVKFVFPILALLIFVPFFLFQTGFIYEVAGVENEAFTLDMNNWGNFKLYYQIADPREVAGAVWMSKYTDVANVIVIADYRAQQSVLTGYGMIGRGQVILLTNGTNPGLGVNQFTFLRPVNVIDGEVDGATIVFNSSLIAPSFGNLSKVFSSGGCEVYTGYLP
jgi:uncharacterized membrane protein